MCSLSSKVVFGVVVVCLFASAALGQPWDGNGIEGDPYQIWDANDMQAIGADPNYWDAHFELMADIDLSAYTGTSFNIIGKWNTEFTGVFDGNGHTISNFSYSAATGLRIGLFGVIGDPNAEIRDVGLIDPNISFGFGDHIGTLVGQVRDGKISGCYVEGGSISARNCVGGLLGTMDDGSITNSHANGSISGQEYVGGLVGLTGGDVSNCFFDGSVSGTDSVGGLAGRLSWYFANVSNCYSAGSVTGEETVGGLIGLSGGGASISDCNSRSIVVGDRTVGGLIGYNATEEWGWIDYPSTVSRCVSLGRVVGVEVVGGLVGGNSGNIIDCNSSVSMSGRYGGGIYDVGGLVGHNGGVISGCHSSGTLVGNRNVGGLVSWNSGEIVASYSERTVSGDAYGVGGLVGYNYNSGIISGSFATGEVSGGSAVGGLVGENEWEISDCYATGKVSGDDSVGGLVGFNLNYDGIGISNCYSIGDVNGTRYHAGGFVGSNVLGVISNCYSAGNVNGTNGVGGFVGKQDNSCVYQRNFWDSDVNPDVNGIGNASDPNVTGETTASMQMAATYMYWSCEGLWTIDEGNDYPRLWWENAPGEVLSNQWYAGGSGEPNDPYLIETAEQLNVIGLVQCDWDNHFKLTADIDLTEQTFNIIGNAENAFEGVFDGNGHVILNFIYEANDTNYVGLFGDVNDPNAVIRDLGLVKANVNVEGGRYIGSLAGWVKQGSVVRCFAEGGSISGEEYVGGLIGFNSGAVSEVYSSAIVDGNNQVGGLVGRNINVDIDVHILGPATIYDSYAIGAVSAKSRYAGGLVGYTRNGEIVNCYSAGTVEGTLDAGGLTGYDRSTWDENSFWDVNSSGEPNSASGTSKTTAEMQTRSTFTDAGWDFVGEIINGPNDIWDICEGTNYPKFVWQIPAADFVCPDGVNFIDYAFFARYWLQAIYGDCGEVELTGDGKVNWVDFALFAEYWMLTGCGECGGADFTGDENVDLADLYVFATYWLGFEYAEVDLTKDGQVDLDDLRQFTENWLAGL